MKWLAFAIVVAAVVALVIGLRATAHHQRQCYVGQVNPTLEDC